MKEVFRLLYEEGQGCDRVCVHKLIRQNVWTHGRTLSPLLSSSPHTSCKETAVVSAVEVSLTYLKFIILPSNVHRIQQNEHI
jgi:hypothetical protein